MDLPPGEEPSRENNYGNLNLPEVPSAEIKPLWDYMKEKTGFDYELFHCDFYRINSFDEVEEMGVFEDLKKK